MVLELHELGYQVYFKNFRCQRQVPRWTKKMGYSSSPSSSTPKSGRWLIISQTVLLGQIFLQLMLMGHFGHFLVGYKGPCLVGLHVSLFGRLGSHYLVDQESTSVPCP